MTDEAEQLKDEIILHLRKMQQWPLRYGENPHQRGAVYRVDGQKSFWDETVLVREPDKSTSYLNINDATAAWRLAWELSERPTAVVVKHANPSGVAIRDNLATAYELARDCDPTSAFGGIVAVNQPVTVEMAQAMIGLFVEVLIAPGYEEGVLEEVWAGKKLDMRILQAPPPEPHEIHFRDIGGAFLVQEWDPVVIDPTKWQVVTKDQPTQDQLEDVALGIRVAARITSNAIVLVKDQQAWGGAGQPNRADSGRLACEKANGKAKGGVYVSEAFFPFPDGLDGAIAAGATCVVQPGGAKGDQAVIDYANANGLSMIFTGERHFKH